MPIAQHIDARKPAACPPAVDGDLAALVREHQSVVWRYLRLLGADPHEADDLMQEAFLLAAEHLRRGERLREPRAFLRTLARNLLIGSRRRASRRAPDVPWADAVDELLQAQPEALEDRRLALLRECVGRLGGRMREAVQLHHVDGVSCADVAARMGLGANGLKSLLLRARNALRECVQGKLQQEPSL